MCALTRQQVREVDRYAIENLGVPGVVLMENAGRNLAKAVDEFLGQARGKRIAVVAGAGNNGGDGFVAARHLAMMGADVTTFLAAPAQQLSGDAEVNVRILRALGHEIRQVDDPRGLAERLRPFDLVVDAIGGTGIRGALRGVAAQVVEQVNAAGRPVVAVDIPTGLDCDTGKAEGPAIRAALTVTFVGRKAGFDAPGAAEYTGVVRVADIGIPAELVLRMIGQP